MHLNTLLKKSFIKILYIVSLFLVISLGFSSCDSLKSNGRSDRKAQQEMAKRQNKAIDEEVKKYDEKYKEQTNRQAKKQKKMIKKSRRKPKGMRKHERSFFLWRWLGI